MLKTTQKLLLKREEEIIIKTKELQIEILDENAEMVCEAFGIDLKLFDAIHKSMHEFFNEKDGTDNLPMRSKVALFRQYLDSEEFKGYHFPMTTNGIFMLGYILANMRRATVGGGGLMEMLHALHQAHGEKDEGEEKLSN